MLLIEVVDVGVPPQRLSLVDPHHCQHTLAKVGHTVGLGHMGYVQDGVRQEYYRPPNGPTLWVPIMGVPGNGLYAQWSNGR